MSKPAATSAKSLLRLWSLFYVFSTKPNVNHMKEEIVPHPLLFVLYGHFQSFQVHPLPVLEHRTLGAECSVQCAVCNVQCTVCSVQFAVCSVQCAVFSVQCAVCSVQCAVCSVQCAVCSVKCAVCSVQCTVYSMECLLWSV